ncbi:EamA family transporter RarD [Serratia plymuthica]|uniref:Permease n=1 Tax=Serratia plymuthica S13 TaxID=1348660 RepID=S4YQD3_SERPL|nr:EamA family transporter RarD [Serratia plymuthica]AGP45183.1 permease [Serratia plymuthica S13]AHY08241.1 chemotaxis protein [Serratia plymuthica]ANJ99477.1 chemotaxis protein [Serratia plymuthica]KYG18173.1 EamA-like transporter family protein [Serratia plymuthica]MBI6138880.1 EamA family transporter RarD [Serratia plymuthica]
MIKGIVLSVVASVLFAVMYYYTSTLAPLDGEQVFGWRTLLTVPFLTLFMIFSADWRRVSETLRWIKQRPRRLLFLPLSSALLGVQLWLFLWAPLHGKALEVSLGYFLLPLTMVLAGRVIFRDRLSLLQKLAVGCAIIGVGNELYQVGGVSWATLVVALGYPVYFILRRHFGTDNLGGLWCELALMLPVAGWFAFGGNGPQAALATHPLLYVQIPLLGILSASALVCYILASRLLPFSLFGLLSYVEPVLLVVVALLLGESIGRDEWLTYIPIWLAVLLLVAEGTRHLLRRRQRP